MRFYELIFKNITRQPRVYLSYLFGSSFSVVIFFASALLYFHPQLNDLPYDGNIRWTLITLYFPVQKLYAGSLIVTSLLALLFLLSIFRAFLKERRLNFNLYLLLGMTKGRLRQMIFLENTIIGLLSILLGTGMGWLFSKYILLIGQNILGLDFLLHYYFPLAGLLLTVVSYSVIFLLISITSMLTLTLETDAITLNIESKTYRAPRLNKYAVYFSVVALFLAFFNLFYLGKAFNLKNIRNDSPVFVILLVLIIVIFIGALYLFFDQTLIAFLQGLKAWPKMLNKSFYLPLANLIYRFKQNSTLLFLVTLSSFAALLVISSTIILAEVEVFGNNQKNSVAYTYRAYDIKTPADLTYHQENIDFIVATIRQAGYEVRESHLETELTVLLQSVQVIPRFYEGEFGITNQPGQLLGLKKRLLLLPLSEFNQMADFNGEERLRIAENELVLLNENLGIAQFKYQGKIEYKAQGKSFVEPVLFSMQPSLYSGGVSLLNLTVVSDHFYQRLQAQQALAGDMWEEDLETDNAFALPTTLIHFREWATAPAVDETIRSFLLNRETTLFEQAMATAPQGAKTDELTYFDYSSSYQTAYVEEQEKGTTLLVSAFIGSVFFIFSICIIYFQTFGELEQDRRYYYNLHLIGLTNEERKRLVSLEMLALFFLPLALALVFYLIIVLYAQLIYHYFFWGLAFKLISLLVTCQTLSYFYLRRHYLKQLSRSSWSQN